ncbi:sulfurtransferase TusA family protein [Rhizobium halophilum]|uniref:sulfurtransferase TusA family protein n=1 Tax=Rhizobium halophilum TaxID=2846852 RepID=UPI001EFC8B23|nr:sulfurtransferase TusA family protein [Rhizobium halophilum]MCF6368802.1 sulfurtransferase TusA family protein [Rhizobium halophilum]
MPDIAQLYDLRGLKCPLPVLKTRKRMNTMSRGEELLIETSDPLAGIDIAHFCHEDGHQLMESEKTESGHRFRIRKG